MDVWLSLAKLMPILTGSIPYRDGGGSKRVAGGILCADIEVMFANDRDTGDNMWLLTVPVLIVCLLFANLTVEQDKVVKINIHMKIEYTLPRFLHVYARAQWEGALEAHLFASRLTLYSCYRKP
uniref:Uncharacterized protein n=1 Tax=Anopheles culicifacies TaxID=139723 RepID=A0A182LVZ1_9DIPT